jgi:hypothetical protein
MAEGRGQKKKLIKPRVGAISECLKHPGGCYISGIAMEA